LIISRIDHDGNGLINYSEFVASTIDVSDFLTEERVIALFKSFDCDDDEKIEEKNIVEAMMRIGVEVSEEEVKEIIKMHDMDQDGFISLSEFKKMLQVT
jgi:calcium-dependent protein kinase